MGLNSQVDFVSLATLLLLISMATISTAPLGACTTRPSPWGWRKPPSCKRTYPNRTFIVGESSGWTFGYNYTDWACKNGPFYVNDVLVFRYNASYATAHPHSVSLMKDWGSYVNCSLGGSRQVANRDQGAGDGFKLVLTRTPYLIACLENNRIHCTIGNMKMVVWPLEPPCKQ